METDLNKIASLSKFNQDENWEFRTFLKGFDAKEIDSIVHEIYQQVSSKIDCISCGNCCKIIQPVLNDKDIDQLSKSLKINTETFKERYLDKDESDKNIFNIAGLKCLNRFQVTQEACEVFNLDKELVAEVTSAYFSGQETPRSPNTCFKTDKANRELDFKPISIQEGLDHMKNNPLPERTRII